MLTALHIIGQILFGGFFIRSGINHFVKHKELTGYGQHLKLPMPGTAIWITGAMLIIGGLGVLFNTFVLPSLIILAIFLIPTTLIAHAFWKITDPQMRMNQEINFYKNVALLGAVLLMMNW